MAKIRVVDDSSMVREEVAGFLRKHGPDVATADDGKARLAKRKTDPSIKLVVSDVDMPVMGGLTMAEKIRSALKNSMVKIICEREGAVPHRANGSDAAQPAMEPLAEWGNLWCGALNRDLLPCFPHLGMSTPNRLRGVSLGFIDTLGADAFSHFRTGIGDGCAAPIVPRGNPESRRKGSTRSGL